MEGVTASSLLTAIDAYCDALNNLRECDEFPNYGVFLAIKHEDVKKANKAAKVVRSLLARSSPNVITQAKKEFERRASAVTHSIKG